jgi:hypothetical protein
MTLRRVTKLGRIGIDGLNELAAAASTGTWLLNHRPSSPTFWFYNLAISGRANTWRSSLTDLLSDDAKHLLTLVDVGKYEAWCMCADRSLHAGKCYCLPCLEDRHDECQQSDRCDLSHGEIHFASAAA